jgi:hypothetical protein
MQAVCEAAEAVVEGTFYDIGTGKLEKMPEFIDDLRVALEKWRRE